MKITFFDDEPEIYPLQYGGKARTITNLAKRFVELPNIERVTILSKSIYSNEEKFVKNGINYVSLNDNNIIEKIAYEMNNTDILNIHCCSFTFPIIKGKAKKFYFLHDVLIATAEKGSHLDKALGGQFDAIIAPSEFAKSIYEKNKKIIKGKTKCYVIPRNIDEDIFYNIKKDFIKSNNDVPKLVKDIVKKYKYVLFFPSRPIEEKGGKYLKELSDELNKKINNYCIIGPFGNSDNLPENFINTGWIKTEELKYYYSISNVTLNFSLLPESFSQICIESVICGTPVVSFASGNIPYLSKLMNSIILVKKDVSHILNGIALAFKLKKDEKQMQSAKQTIRENFNSEKIVEKYINLYEKYMEE